MSATQRDQSGEKPAEVTPTSNQPEGPVPGKSWSGKVFVSLLIGVFVLMAILIRFGGKMAIEGING